MQKRTLGKTGLEVSILGFGASPLGGVFGEVTQAQADHMVLQAVDAGINLFDVSPYYGKTRAETVLGEALKNANRDSIVLATKVGRYDSAEFDFSAARTIKSVEESLQRLQVDVIDIIQCHDIEFVPLNQIIAETIPALRDLQKQGKVRFVGITGLPLKVFSTVLDEVELDTILSYCHHTLYDRTLSQALPELRAHGVGVINAASLGMGLLTDRALPDWHPAPAELRAACAQVNELCVACGVSLAAVALQWALQEPDIASTLVGIGSVKQLEENIASAHTTPDADLIRRIEAVFAGVVERFWPSGLPENN